MRLILGTALALASTAALATELPVSAIYGNQSGCRVFASNDRDWEAQRVDALDWLIVEPSAISGHEWECTADKVHGTQVTLSCGEAGDEGNASATSATIAENKAAGSLLYTDKTGTLTLRRCQ